MEGCPGEWQRKRPEYSELALEDVWLPAFSDPAFALSARWRNRDDQPIINQDIGNESASDQVVSNGECAPSLKSHYAAQLSMTTVVEFRLCDASDIYVAMAA
jgi:hypothetical protein